MNYQSSSLTTVGAEANNACNSLKSTKRTLSSKGLSRVVIRFFSANREILLGLTPNRLAACLIDIHCGSLICLFTSIFFVCSQSKKPIVSTVYHIQVYPTME